MSFRPAFLASLAWLVCSPDMTLSQTPADLVRKERENCTVTDTLGEWVLDYIAVPADTGEARRTVYTHTPSAFGVTMTFDQTQVTGGRINMEEAIGQALDLNALTWKDAGVAEENIWVTVETAAEHWSTSGVVQGMQVVTTGEIFVQALRGDDGPDHFTDLLVLLLASDSARLSIGMGETGVDPAVTHDMQTSAIAELAARLGALETRLSEKLAKNDAECF